MVHVQAPQFSHDPLFQHRTHIEGGHIPNGETIATVNVLGGFNVSNVVSLVHQCELWHDPTIAWSICFTIQIKLSGHLPGFLETTSKNRQQLQPPFSLQNASRKCRSIGAFVLITLYIVFSTLSLVDSGKWLANQWSAWRFQAWKVWSAPWIPGWKKLPACNHSKKNKEYHALKRNKLNVQKIYHLISFDIICIMYKYLLTSDLCSLVTVIRNLAQV